MNISFLCDHQARFRNGLLGITVIANLIGAAPAGAAPLPRSNIVLPNAISVDATAQTVTLPLQRGHVGSKTVWYIVTDSSDKADAAKRGAIFAPLLANVGSGCSACVEQVDEQSGELAFKGAPDFSKSRRFAAGPTGFPPKDAVPGATASSSYSPFIRIGSSSTVINAPIVATGTGPFDVVTHTNTQERVVAVDTVKKTATLLLVHGFANGRDVLYISTEATDAGVATIERATYVPSLAKATGGTIPIFVIANGPLTTKPQGLAYAALRGKLDEDATVHNTSSLRASMNVLATFPTGAGAAAYTPLWSANLGVWTTAAVAAHENTQLTKPQQVADAASRNELTGPGGKPFGPIGVLVNCAVVAYVDAAP